MILGANSAFSMLNSYQVFPNSALKRTYNFIWRDVMFAIGTVAGVTGLKQSALID